MLSWLLTGGAIPSALILTGAFFVCYLKGGPFAFPKKWFASLQKPSAGGVSSFRALTLALAGTLGVGNLVGVADAVLVGGAGAIFWMWVSSLFAMVLKYAEILLAVSHRRAGRKGACYGGAFYYMKDHFEARRLKKHAKLLPPLFASLMIADALFMGCVVQSGAVSEAFFGILHIPRPVLAVLLLLLVMPFAIGSSKRISALTEWLVPLMAGGYLFLSAAVLFLERERLPAAFSQIFREAFSARSAAGGTLGFFTSRALRVGTMRGLLSNEAGCGSAPTAHASASASSPAEQGIWGMIEVFVDTVLLCTASALVFLVGGKNPVDYAGRATLFAIDSYVGTLGGFASVFFSVAIFFFAFATVLCWTGYGMENLRALGFGRRGRSVYLVLVAGAILLGVFLSPSVAFLASDVCATLMTTVNLSVLLAMRREIRHETERWKNGADTLRL